MKWLFTRGRMMKLSLAAGTTLVLGGCGLTDQQLTQIFSSVLQSGLTTVFTQLLSALVGGATGTTA